MLLVLEGVLGFHKISQLQFLQHQCLGIDLDYSDVEWFALEMNQDPSVIFEDAPKYCIVDSFTDCESYSTSSKGVLPTVAAAAAKSLQSCPTLCHPRDGSPPGSPVPRILQARTLEWVAISFSNA